MKRFQENVIADWSNDLLTDNDFHSTPFSLKVVVQ